jgi:hypothetical protein
MARANTLKFSEFVFQFGDGATPTETFSRPCGVTSRDFAIEPNTSDTAVPDCDDEDAASWLDRDTVSMSASGNIAGTVDDDDFDSLLDWAMSGNSRNARILIKARRLDGAFKIALTSSAERGKRVTFSAKLTSDGVLTRVS